jgi:DNA-binding CsgD family transcriptional regulator
MRATRNKTAASLWRNLVAGRFVVGACRDIRGRRHVWLRDVSAAMDPLIESRRLALVYRAYGWSLDRIAAELGLTLAGAHYALRGGIERLGLRSEFDLALVFGAGLQSAGYDRGIERRPPARLVRDWVRTNPWRIPAGHKVRRLPRSKNRFVLSFPVREKRWRDLLTVAEVDIVDEVLTGLSYPEIGRRRGTSRVTVANQMNSVLRKLRLQSRLDLALFVFAGRHRGGRRRARR